MCPKYLVLITLCATIFDLFLQDKYLAFIRALKKDLPLFAYEFLKLGIDPSKIFLPNTLSKGETRYETFLTNLYDSDIPVCYISENKKKIFIFHTFIE